MIDRIEIMIRNGSRLVMNALIMYREKVCYVNGKEYNISDSFLGDIVRSISLWKNDYGRNNIIDSESFKVVVTHSNKQDVFTGNGIFPNNYLSFKKLIGDLDER